MNVDPNGNPSFRTQTKSALRRLFRQPSFLVAAGILLVAAVSLNAATQYLQLNFHKLPVDLAKPLDTVPATMGPWVQVSSDEALESDFAHILGTDKYIFRDYVDSRLVSRAVLSAFNDKSAKERKQLFAKLQRENPRAVMNLAVTYYTGMVDTVAHIPDRCYIANGFDVSKYENLSWPIFEARPPLALRYITFEDQTTAGRETVNVAYFFHSNGQYEPDPIGVRMQLQDLRQRYGYYAKVELMTLMRDTAQAKAVMADFLSHVMPEVEKCLPDWKKVTAAPATQPAK